ncbi:histidine phosphatase family protein [Candidatus Contubernalis alkaliaceticus]|uniref:histidine phosphatase family protein n=1 Tax=Candidatus Contubernalis alkaliaceticus TaxID=338645 RepID=UPI001F4C1EC1|nr:histidine phosphatase family protein [Candidatus Contubernalis alkalaceticus]UNC93700.1 histidine phosphatase family protein [Candidatus Contubernalis alkalaceticus]
MELFLVRHGQTKANKENRFQGCIDYPLSQTGKREAQQAALRLASISLDVIYSSPLVRAYDTAQIIANAQHKDVRVLTSLKEFRWGVIEGLTREEIQQKHPGLAYSLKKGFQKSSIPGQEPIDIFWNRVNRTINFLCGAHAGKRVLVVSHGRFLNAFAASFFNMSICNSWPFRFSHGSLSLFEVNREGRRVLIFFNDTCHLGETPYCPLS